MNVDRMDIMRNRNQTYWDAVADEYQSSIRISTDDYHYGPLLPGDRELQVLPVELTGKRCLEIGCGAGQNSIYLARRGADCVAVDVSERQLKHARSLAVEQDVSIDFRRDDMDAMPVAELGTFDVIHTSSLAFSSDPASVVQTMAGMLKPEGRVLLIGLHALHAGDWTELEDGSEGVFVRNYFDATEDGRDADAGHDGIVARCYSVSAMAEWLHRAGLYIERLLEPEPLPIYQMSEQDILARVPYDSPEWRHLYPHLAAVPFAAVFLCRRCLTGKL